jgi:hypothetical protein
MHHDAMIWAIAPAGKSSEDPELALPYAVIREGYEQGLWEALNVRLGLLLEQYEGALIENDKLDQFVAVVTELSVGVTAKTRANLEEVVALATRLRTSGMGMWITL